MDGEKRKNIVWFLALFNRQRQRHRHRQRQNYKYKWQQCNCNHTETKTTIKINERKTRINICHLWTLLFTWDTEAIVGMSP